MLASLLVKAFCHFFIVDISLTAPLVLKNFVTGKYFDRDPDLELLSSFFIFKLRPRLVGF